MKKKKSSALIFFFWILVKHFWHVLRKNNINQNQLKESSIVMFFNLKKKSIIQIKKLKNKYKINTDLIYLKFPF